MITLVTAAGRTTGHYRLITTLADPARYPAAALAALYRERRKMETACFELKSTIPGGRVLRARTPDGIDQEIYALLVTCQTWRDRPAVLHGAGSDAQDGSPAMMPSSE